MGFRDVFSRRGQSDLDRLERCLTKEKLSVGERMRRLERSKGMQVFLWITLVVLLLYAVFAFLYSTVVLYASGKGTSFLWFWPVTCVAALLAVFLLFMTVTGRLPRLKTPVICFCGVFWLCAAVFLVVEAVVFSAGRKAPAADGEYVIVLGAQVRGEVPTLVLSARIRAAAEYLKEHPRAIAVASGGKGSGEDISEAEAIRRGLVRQGISEDRILMEDRSTSTAENLRFSAEVIQNYEQQVRKNNPVPLGGTNGDIIRFISKNVVLVTNDFHVFRAVKLAQGLGYTRISGLGATDFFAVTIQYYVREFFAIGKEILHGNFS
jgi:uncharacterized SAM-binding protein YcdF (DUF218 family)